MNRLIFISIIIGTILEWYDFSLLGSLAPVISSHFFPSSSASLSLLATFSVFATGFIARPLGAIVFGYVGDRHSRSKAFATTILLMTIPTTLIGCLPSYSTIGLLAPVLLIGLRILQGLAASGESPGAICLVAELAPAQYRAFYSSICLLGVTGGTCLVLIVNATLSHLFAENQIYEWAWRIPFLLGMPLGLTSYYIRKNLNASSKEGQSISNAVKPFNQLIANQKPELIKVALLFSLSTVSFYLGFIYLPGYVIHSHSMSFSKTMTDTAITTTMLALLIPLFGIMADKFNRTNLLVLGIIGLGMYFYPMFILTIHFHQLLYAQIGLAFILALLSGPLAITAAQAFDKLNRYTGIAMSINLGAAIFGGTCPLIATYIADITHNPVTPALYAVLLSAICLIYFCSQLSNSKLALNLYSA